MSDEAGLKRLDDAALLMQRQEAADKSDYPRKLELDAEVIRRWGHLRSLLNRRPRRYVEYRIAREKS